MRNNASTHSRPFSPSRSGQRAFTIPEYVMTVALVAIVSTAMLACMLFGGKIFALAQTKLDYGDDIRMFESAFLHAVRTAADLDVGQGNASSFIPVNNNGLRQGNAIQIYSNDNTNDFLRIYLDADDQCLKLLDSDNLAPVTLTDAVTNQIPFTLEDAWGNVTTNDQYSCTVGLLLQFNPPLVRGQSNSMAMKDFYQFRTKVTRRTSLGYEK
jgi:hypothetical protein